MPPEPMTTSHLAMAALVGGAVAAAGMTLMRK